MIHCPLFDIHCSPHKFNQVLFPVNGAACLPYGTSCDLRHGLRPGSRVPKRLTPVQVGRFLLCSTVHVKNWWTTIPILWITRPFSEDNSGYKLCIVLGLEALTAALRFAFIRCRGRRETVSAPRCISPPDLYSSLTRLSSPGCMRSPLDRAGRSRVCPENTWTRAFRTKAEPEVEHRRFPPNHCASNLTQRISFGKLLLWKAEGRMRRSRFCEVSGRVEWKVFRQAMKCVLTSSVSQVG